MQGALSRILVTCGHWGTQTHLKVEAKQNNLSHFWYDKVSFLVISSHILGDIFDYFRVHLIKIWSLLTGAARFKSSISQKYSWSKKHNDSVGSAAISHKRKKNQYIPMNQSIDCHIC